MNRKTKKPKLFVATPMYGGMCTGFYTESCMGLTNAATYNNIELMFTYIVNESLIQRARNTLANIFIEDTDCTHMLFVDADIKFNPTDVMEMIKYDKDVSCAIYPKKEINWGSVSEAVKLGVPTSELQNHTASMVINLIDYKEQEVVKYGEPIKVQSAGTGFMIIKREVFESMKSKVSKYAKRNAKLYSTDEKDYEWEYFACSIQDETRILLSEDYHFCEKAREIGYDIYAFPWIKLAHFGTYLFEGHFKQVENGK